jgi:transketolase C-terminal domain/subunit
MASQRKAYGQTLLELGKDNPDIVALDADLCPSTMTGIFAGDSRQLALAATFPKMAAMEVPRVISI